MKTNLYSLILACATLPLFSQVGINTSAPTATLDINGNMRVRNTPAATTVPGYQLLVQDNSTTSVFAMDPQLLIGAANVNSGMYAAKKTSGISLLSLSLFPTGFRSVNFLAAERTIGSGAMFSDTDNTFIIPSDGVYYIGFSFRYGSGVQASVLANSPGIGILRNRSGVGAIIDSRTFSGIDAVLLKITVSDSSINSIYSLKKDDKISFGLVGSSLLDAGLLDSSVASFTIYKVSN